MSSGGAGYVVIYVPVALIVSIFVYLVWRGNRRR